LPPMVVLHERRYSSAASGLKEAVIAAGARRTLRPMREALAYTRAPVGRTTRTGARHVVSTEPT
jgi:hypothetical protein